MLFPDPGIGRRHRRTFSRADYGRRSAAGPQDAYDFAVEISQSDGLFPVKAGGAMANSAEVAFCGGTMLEAAVGTIASAQLFATLPSLAFGTELFGLLLLTEKILQGP